MLLRYLSRTLGCARDGGSARERRVLCPCPWFVRAFCRFKKSVWGVNARPKGVAQGGWVGPSPIRWQHIRRRDREPKKDREGGGRQRREQEHWTRMMFLLHKKKKKIFFNSVWRRDDRDQDPIIVVFTYSFHSFKYNNIKSCCITWILDEEGKKTDSREKSQTFFTSLKDRRVDGRGGRERSWGSRLYRKEKKKNINQGKKYFFFIFYFSHTFNRGRPSHRPCCRQS